MRPRDEGVADCDEYRQAAGAVNAASRRPGLSKNSTLVRNC